MHLSTHIFVETRHYTCCWVPETGKMGGWWSRNRKIYTNLIRITADRESLWNEWFAYKKPTVMTATNMSQCCTNSLFSMEDKQSGKGTLAEDFSSMCNLKNKQYLSTNVESEDKSLKNNDSNQWPLIRIEYKPFIRRDWVYFLNDNGKVDAHSLRNTGWKVQLWNLGPASVKLVITIDDNDNSQSNSQANHSRCMHDLIIDKSESQKHC